MTTTLAHMPRPSMKRASLTWPGDATRRSHFEDFLREIGADPESTLLCCRGTSPHPHVHAAHTRKGSATSHATKTRVSPSRADKARALPEGSGRRPTADLQTPPANAARGRTMSRPAAMKSPSMAMPPKSPALSFIDLDNHDATPTYNHFASARDALLPFVGGTPVDERPSRAPTRTFLRDRVPVSRSPGSAGSSPSPLSSAASARRSPARSASRTPSIDSVDTASSSEAPATPKTQSILAHELPTLDDLERTSRFRVDGKCVRCHRSGSNFPSCPKCGEMWCSRECRLQGQRGAASTHACHGRTGSA